MSSTSLKGPKTKALFTSAVAAALAPAMTGESNEDYKDLVLEHLNQNMESIPFTEKKPLRSSVFKFNSQINKNKLSEKLSSDVQLVSALPEREISLTEKNFSVPLHLQKRNIKTANDSLISSEIPLHVWPEDTILSIGDEGPKVATIQTFLSEIGYYVNDIDGLYGSKTREGILLYQKEHGLKIDGIAGPETLNHLLGVKTTVLVEENQQKGPASFQSDIFRPMNGNTANLYINTTINDLDLQDYSQDSQDSRDYLMLGDSGEEVDELQDLLKKAGYYSGSVDSIYGSFTQQAVRMLQREHNLSVDGLAGNQVISFLQTNDLKRIATKREQTQAAAAATPSRGRTSPGTSTSSSSGSTNSVSSSRSSDTANKSSSSSESSDKTESSPATSPPTSNQPSPATAAVPVEDIIGRAQQLVGSPYIWGGTSPAGFDCSGFLGYVYKHGGVELPRTVSQIWGASTSVSSPSRGDIVFFETYKKGPSHAGVYLGGGAFIHASSSKGIMISNVSDIYWNPRYLGAKRP